MEGVTNEYVNSMVPSLPFDKDFHVFMCYCKENVDEVHTIVNHLEAAGFKCSFHERDFTPGERVLDNMNRNITKSMNMVIILSEDFSGSRFCSHEVEQALHMRVAEGYPVIPVKIEPCAVPSSLLHLTWINAENDATDEIHNKIIDAITKRDAGSTANELKNGMTLHFPLTTKRQWLSLPRYSFSLGPTDREYLWTKNCQLSVAQMNEIETIMESSVLVKYHHIYDSFRLLFLPALLMFTLCLTLIVFIQLSTMFGTNPVASQKGDKAVVNTTGAGVLLGLLLVIVCGSYDCTGRKTRNVRWTGRITKKQQYQAVQRIRKRLWKVNKHYKMLKLLVAFNFNFTNEELIVHDFFCLTKIVQNITLDVMRYDFGPCHRKFQKRCEQKENLCSRRIEGESLESYADRMFDWYLDSPSISCLMTPRIWTQARHHMENGAPCLCLLLEEALSKTS